MTVAVILARAGSKRIPGKNLCNLAGFPLILWTLEAARQAQVEIVISSDNPDILRIAEEYAVLGVPRPPELAQDDSPDAPAIRHALEALGPTWASDDIVVHLRPTAPFRRPEDIDEVVKRLERLPADSIVSVRPARDHPRKCFVETGETIGILPELVAYTGASALGEPSQGLEKVWHAAGFVDAAKIGRFLQEGRMDCGTILGWPAPVERAVDLDTPEDWAMAEQVAERRGWIPGLIG